MTDTTPNTDTAATRIPLPEYHVKLLKYLREQHHELWEWFDSNPIRSRHADSVRLTLLRTAYRIDRESHQPLYQLADAVAQDMNLSAPVFLYQAQDPHGRNASLAWLPNEAHIVLHGDLQDLLTDDELSALIAHELAHHELWSMDGQVFLTVEQVLQAMVTDRAAGTSHDRTSRVFQLYTELYCDRRAAEVCEDPAAIISALVKLDTGVKDISADAYVTQAREILSTDPRESEGLTHPEMYLRAHALAIWDNDHHSADRLMQPLIEGPLRLDRLDLLRQHQLSRFTEWFLRDFLQPPWLQTSIMTGHLRRFFAEFRWERSGDEAAADSDDDLLTIADVCDDPQLQRYLCYLLLDCVTVDPDLEDGPLAAAFLFADRHQLSDLFESIVREELRPGKRHFSRIRRNAAEITAAAETEFAE